MNNKVNFLRGTSTEYATSTKDNDTFYYTTDDEKLYLGNKEITGIEIDDTSTTATDKTWSAKHIEDTKANKDDVPEVWSGTKNEWNALNKTTISDGAIINITDDYDGNVPIPTKTSELTNDSGFITSPDGGNAASVGGKTITVTDVDPGAGAVLNTGEIVFVTGVT